MLFVRTICGLTILTISIYSHKGYDWKQASGNDAMCTRFATSKTGLSVILFGSTNELQEAMQTKANSLTKVKLVG